MDANAESFIMAWPASERVLDDDEGNDFECVMSPASLSSSVLAAAMADDTTQDSLLDALARLQEERARSELLRQQVEVARALASLPNCGKPEQAASMVAAAWRGKVLRRRLADQRTDDQIAASRLLQRNARHFLARVHGIRHKRQSAATRIELAFRRYSSTLARSSKSALRRDTIRLRGHFDTLRGQCDSLRGQCDSLLELQRGREFEVALAFAKKDEAIDAHIERHIETTRLQRDALKAQSEGAAARDAQAAEREATLEARVSELEGLVNSLCVDKATLGAQLDEQRVVTQSLEDKLSASAIDKEQAEELASRLLAEKLSSDSWPTAACAQAAAAAPAAAARSLSGSLSGSCMGWDEQDGGDVHGGESSVEAVRGRGIEWPVAPHEQGAAPGRSSDAAQAPSPTTLQRSF